MPGNFRTGTSFPGSVTLGEAGTDTFSGRTDGVDVISAEVVNSLANSVVKAQQNIAINQPLTALGDLYVGGIGGAPGRLGVGADGEVLTLVSGEPQWQAPAGAADEILTATATLTSAEFLTLNSAFVEIVPAPAPGQAILVLYAEAFLDYGTTPYSNGGSLTIRNGTTNNQMVFLSAASYTSASDRYTLKPVSINEFTLTTGESVVISASVPITTGDSVYKVRVYYKVITLLT